MLTVCMSSGSPSSICPGVGGGGAAQKSQPTGRQNNTARNHAQVRLKKHFKKMQ